MKNIHPAYHPVRFQDRTSGTSFITRSTLGKPDELVHLVVDVTSSSHPAWTGFRYRHDAEGRVAAFERRFGKKNRAS